MEHILQFAINIDDEGIKRSVSQSATDKLAKELLESVKNKIFDNRWSDSGFTQYGEKIVKDFFDKHKDEIIERSVALVVESIKRSKKYREALADVVEELK